MFEVQRFYGDGAQYDLEYLGYQPDIAFWVDLAKEFASDGGRLLNMCCGTLREGIPLARAGVKHGFTLTGVDITPKMLEQGRKKLASEPIEVQQIVTLVEGDMRTINVGEREYDLVIVSFTSFLHMLTTKDQLAALGNLRRHLKPETGRLLVDIFMPDVRRLALGLGAPWIRKEKVVEDEESGELLIRKSATEYDPISQILDVIFTYELYELHEPGELKHQWWSPLKLRVIHPPEWELLLRTVSLTIVEKWGDYQRTPFGEGSPKMLFLAKRDS